MTQNKNNLVSRRIVLLATDRSHSIIGEIVDGKSKTIAYSAFGEQSAQQEIETRLGFNGQLREGNNIGWYLLGNGYRAYNTRLMRFHSPDSWSPFRGGGLNAYMYCVGDPVNRSDPTGHMSFRKFLGKTFDFFFGGPDVGMSRLHHEMMDDYYGPGTRRVSHSEGKALLSTVAGILFTPTRPRPPSVQQGGDLHPVARGWEPPLPGPGIPLSVSRSAQTSNLSGALSRTGNPIGGPTHSGPPPTKLWSPDTFAASHQPQTYSVYPVGVGTPSPSQGTVQLGNTSSSSVLASSSAEAGSSTHSSANRPTAVVAAIRRDPPAPHRSPTPSPPTSRDSTPQSTPASNRRYGPNGDRYT